MLGRAPPALAALVRTRTPARPLVRLALAHSRPTGRPQQPRHLPLRATHGDGNGTRARGQVAMATGGAGAGGVPVPTMDAGSPVLAALAARGAGAADGLASAKAIFVYGTLRPDYSTQGDRWGVVPPGTVFEGDEFDAPHGCFWMPGWTEGFRLLQEKKLGYPFAHRCPGHGIHGTLLHWADDDEFEDALRRCDHIEGV